jgi:hypothetical protein
MVLRFSLPVVLLEEILKYIGRHLNEIKEIAYKRLKEANDIKNHGIVPPPVF